jgi:hypothetical protein
MKQWHAEHMEKTVIKYANGLSEGASAWEKKQHKRYCTFGNICKQIDYDMKHGVTKEEVLLFIQDVRSHSSFAKVRKNDGSVLRLEEMQEYFMRQQQQQQKAAAIAASTYSPRRLF